MKSGFTFFASCCLGILTSTGVHPFLNTMKMNMQKNNADAMVTVMDYTVHTVHFLLKMNGLKHTDILLLPTANPVD